MADAPRVVAHLTDGMLIKGTTQDFNPSRPSFHLIPVGSGPVAEIRCEHLKAVFFVKSLEGNPRRRDLSGFIAAPGATAHGKKVAVRFTDGELLCGYTLSHRLDRGGFFLFPADSESNNLRVYVVVAATVEIKFGIAAEALVRDALAKAGT